MRFYNSDETTGGIHRTGIGYLPLLSRVASCLTRGTVLAGARDVTGKAFQHCMEKTL
jgi:hypothetical protein